MDSYLYGGDAAKAAADNYARADNDLSTTSTFEDNRRRSKSYDPSKFLGVGATTRTRNTEIERGVRIKYKSTHNLAADQNDRYNNEKLKLNELNGRLDELVNAIKQKKLINDNLEAEIKNYKDQVLNHSDNSLRKQYTADLDEAKKELNNVSQLSSLSKIRASRSVYDLDTLRNKFDQEVKLQKSASEKISYLENQYSESLNEISYLKESCENRERSNLEDEDKNERLRSQITEISMRLDGELESRVDLECRIQTMLEQKKFEEEIANLMRDELEKLFLYHGNNKLFDDPHHFFNTELNQIKERIREDFKKLNDYSSQSVREEYEYKYSKTVEEIEISRKKAEEDRNNAENEEMMTINGLKQEHLENEEELKNLRLNGFRLSQTLEELRNRLTDHSQNLNAEAERRDIEIADLIDQINNLKIEMSTMLNFSKTLDSEVSVYARLLNERFTQFMSTDSEHVNYDSESSTKFSYDKYKESIFGNSQDEDNEARRRLEQEELRKKQQELDNHQRRLRELELERGRERENERLRRQQGQEEERERERENERLRRQQELDLEEQRRKQREIDERNRQIREEEESLRRQQQQREEEEATLRRQRELDLEEQRRGKQREIDERNRQIREEEEAALRRRRDQEEAAALRRQREEEEAALRKRQRELEEQNKLRELEKRQYELEMETTRIWELEQKRLREIEEIERLNREEEERESHLAEKIHQAAYDMEQRRLKEEDEHRRVLEQRRREEYELQQRYETIEQQRLRQIEDELALKKMEEDHMRQGQREYEIEQRRIREENETRLSREQQRLQEIEDQKRRDRDVELKRLEDIIVAEQQRKIYEKEERQRRQQQEQEEEDLRKRRQKEISAEKLRQQEMELARILREQQEQRDIEEQRRAWELENKNRRDLDEQKKRQLEIDEQQRRLKDEQQYQWEQEQIRIREVETRRTQEQEQIRIREIREVETRRIQELEQIRIKEVETRRTQEQEQQRRLELEREERERYILEKLKQEQELLELQKRQKLMTEQREREEYELEYRQRQQELQPAYQHSQREVKCIDNISTITKRITEEKHKSTEIYEEERIEHIPGNNSISNEQVEKQIDIKLHPNGDNHYHSSQNLLSESSSGSRHRKDSSHHHSTNNVDHCISSNNGHKHVLIVNTQGRKPTSTCISNVNTVNSRSQSPPKVRSQYITNSASNDALSTTNTVNSNKTDTNNGLSPKYAIKHKANRYVSGAIGILETSLNGEYIILENLSSNKNVNLKGWYIHRYVPDQNINLIFKFVNDTMLCSGEKLKILSRSCSTKIRSTSMYESVNNKPNQITVTDSFQPKDKFITNGNEKILIATNIENWGTYSKFSVTKLINPEGVDKAVLTQSLLRLASSTSNVNLARESSSPRESSPSINKNQTSSSSSNNNKNSSYYYNRAISNNNNNNNLNTRYRADNEISLRQVPTQQQYYDQYSPRSQQSASESYSTRTTKKTESTSSSHLTSTLTSTPYVVDQNILPGNVHVTRQF